MRIGIDARFYSPAFTGIGRYVYELVNRIILLDTKNEYVLFFNEPYFSQFVPPRAGVRKVLTQAGHYTVAEQWDFYKILQNEHLDLMHFTHFNAPLLYRRPSIVTIHDLTLSLYPGRKMTSLLHRTAYHMTIGSIVRRARQVIAVSKNTAHDIAKLLRARATQITTIYEGVSASFHPIKNQTMCDQFRTRMYLNKPYLLYTGVWRSHKNIAGLLQAFRILKKKYHFEGLLVITGKPDPLYSELPDMVKKLDLQADVRFVGHVSESDLILLYNCAHLYVLPSFYEGFGLPILEAFACGTPVCCSNTSCLPEVAGKDGAVFFNPHDPNDIAAKIIATSRDAQKRHFLSQNGLIRARDFNWDSMARETLKVYSRPNTILSR